MAEPAAKKTARKATRRKPAPVEVRNVAHPGIWAAALRLAGGDPKRLRVESYARVLVMPKEAG